MKNCPLHRFLQLLYHNTRINFFSGLSYSMCTIIVEERAHRKMHECFCNLRLFCPPGFSCDAQRGVWNTLYPKKSNGNHSKKFFTENLKRILNLHSWFENVSRLEKNCPNYDFSPPFCQTLCMLSTLNRWLPKRQCIPTEYAKNSKEEVSFLLGCSHCSYLWH